MATGYVINKQKLLELYPQHLTTIGKDIGGGNMQFLANAIAKGRVDALPDQLQVRVLQKTKPFSIVKLLQISGADPFIIPEEMIETIEIPKAIDQFKPILDRMYPNRWGYSVGSQELYIHYPTLTIKNHLGHTHEITDLVVQIIMGDDTIIANHLQGTRLSYTSEELSIGYVHSHLHTSHYELSSFCRGGDSVFNSLLASYGKINTPLDFELFCSQLDYYLSWESLEGTPYISIRQFFEHKKLNGILNTHSYLSELQEVLLDAFTLEMLKELKGKVSLVQPYNVFDPSSPGATTWAAEKAVTERLRDRLEGASMLHDYDESQMLYVETAQLAPPRIKDGTRKIAEHIRLRSGLNIQPRIEQSKRVYNKPTTIKRMSTSNLKHVFNRMNRMLIKGLNYEGNNVKTQSEGDNNTTASVPDLVLA